MIGNRLKRAREAAGLSLRELEAAIESQVSAQAVGKYERDEMMPGSAALLALSRALNVPPEFLLSTRQIELAGIDFRKAPQAGMKEVRSVEAAVLDQVERYLALEELMPVADDRSGVRQLRPCRPRAGRLAALGVRLRPDNGRARPAV